MAGSSDAQPRWLRVCMFIAFITYSHCQFQEQSAVVAVSDAFSEDILLGQVGAAALSGKLALTDLPLNAQARPAMPAGGWGFCDNLRRAQCVEETVDVKESWNPTAGQPGLSALRIFIKHKVLKEVTPEMMLWLYSNLEKTYPYTVGGKTYNSHSLFLRMHPVDHAYFAARTEGGKRQVDFVETPLIGCTQPTRLNKAVPYNCPSTRQGLVQNPSPGKLDDIFQTKLTQYVAQMDNKGYATYTEASNDQLARFGCTTCNVSSLQIAWQNAAGGGVSISTTLLVGLMKVGTHNELNDAALVSYANAQIVKRFNETAQWKDKNVRYLGYASAMHFVQEIQYLAKWLPDAYKQHGSK